MTDGMFEAVLARTGCEKSKDGIARLPEGRTLTLYAAHDGVSLQVARITEISREGEAVEARNNKGETFVMSLGDIFAASMTGDADGPSRKAGFLG